MVSNPSKSKPNLLEDAMAKLQRTNAILSCLSDVANDGRVERVQSLVRSPKDGVDGSRCPNGLAANNRGQSRTQDDAAALATHTLHGPAWPLASSPVEERIATVTDVPPPSAHRNNSGRTRGAMGAGGWIGEGQRADSCSPSNLTIRYGVHGAPSGAWREIQEENLGENGALRRNLAVCSELTSCLLLSSGSAPFVSAGTPQDTPPGPGPHRSCDSPYPPLSPRSASIKTSTRRRSLVPSFSAVTPSRVTSSIPSARPSSRPQLDEWPRSTTINSLSRFAVACGPGTRSRRLRCR